MKDDSHGTYNWPVTKAEENMAIACEHGAAIEGSRAEARRYCDLRGKWMESNFSECASFSVFTLRNISSVRECVHVR